ncbi:hypothetical protein FPV67DRAFT_1445431 [Lyophyllum atratum]|nr:hypothetical protein FPV67DRAFT_1445431 [Lyophyllum atratum]
MLKQWNACTTIFWKFQDTKRGGMGKVVMMAASSVSSTSPPFSTTPLVMLSDDLPLPRNCLVPWLDSKQTRLGWLRLGHVAWAEMLREKTALPDLAGIMSSRTQRATVRPRDTVPEVAQLILEKDISAVCILEEAGPVPSGAVQRPSKIAGIFTSKD